jgi:CopG family transcriptional regulator / antitoxin EndoAI
LALDIKYTIIVYRLYRNGGNDMSTCTVNIAFQKDLLREIDEVARVESRSRSEFLREAARAYIQRKRRWADIFSMGRMIARDRGLTLEDVSREIEAYRKDKASQK